MKKFCDVVKWEVAGDKTIMVWHRYDEDRGNNEEAGMWVAAGKLDKKMVEIWARSHADADIETRVL
jgi:hypothetical protein